MVLTDGRACGQIDAAPTSIKWSDSACVAWSTRSWNGNGAPSMMRMAVFDDVAIRHCGDEFARSTLWPLLHGWLQRPRFRAEWWRSYQLLNERIARCVGRAAPRNAMVWINSHQYLLVPARLRATRPDVKIALVIDTPFPGVELFSRLPWRSEVLQGMAGADVIGFQTDRDAANGRLSLERYLVDSPDLRPRNPHGRRIVTLPAPVDFARWDELGHSRRPRSSPSRVARRQDPQRGFLFLCVDSVDGNNGVDVGLTAFGELLDEQRLDASSCCFVQLSAPAASDPSDHRAELLRQRNRLVWHINQRHGDAMGNSRVAHVVDPIDDATRGMWYLAADSLLVLPLAEGMGLAAKEFAATRVDLDASVILSEFSGAASHLPGAKEVNPYDVDGIKQAMVEARTMGPCERTRRMQTMRSAARRHDVSAWAASLAQVLVGGSGSASAAVVGDRA
jgi:trehalose 6-phosphate synthase